MFYLPAIKWISLEFYWLCHYLTFIFGHQIFVYFTDLYYPDLFMKCVHACRVYVYDYELTGWKWVKMLKKKKRDTKPERVPEQEHYSSMATFSIVKLWILYAIILVFTTDYFCNECFLLNCRYAFNGQAPVIFLLFLMID